MRLTLRQAGFTDGDSIETVAAAAKTTPATLRMLLNLDQNTATVPAKALGRLYDFPDGFNVGGSTNAQSDAAGARRRDGRLAHGTASGHVLRESLKDWGARLEPPASNADLGGLPRVDRMPGDTYCARPAGTGVWTPAGPTEPLTWESFNRQVGEEMYWTMKDRGRPTESTSNLRMLALLGVGWNGDEPVIAEPTTIRKRLKVFYDERGIPADQRYDLAVAYRLPDDTFGFAFLGDDIPPGAVHYAGVLPSELFARMLVARAFVAGGHEMANGYVRQTTFEHDLAHVTAAMEHPQLVPALAAFSSRVEAGHPIHNQVVYDTFESMACVLPENRSALLALLDLPATGDRIPDLEEVEAHLAAKSPEERFELARRLDTEALPLVVELGGAARDGANMNHGLASFWLRGRLGYVRPHMLIPGEADRGTPESITPLRLAEGMLGLRYLADLTPERWFAEALAGSPRGSALHGLMVESGEWWRYHAAYYTTEDFGAGQVDVLSNLPRALRRDAQFMALAFDYRKDSATPLGPVEVDALLACPWIRDNPAGFLEVTSGNTFAFTPDGLQRLAWASAARGVDGDTIQRWLRPYIAKPA